MKYKLGDDGNIVKGEGGHPIVIQDDGSEIELKATDIFETKLPALNAENKQFREQKKDAEKALNDLKSSLGDLDIAEARKALVTIKGLESKDLINAEDANTARIEIEKALKGDIETLQKEHGVKMKGVEDKNTELINEIFGLKVSDRFKGSQALKGTIFENAPEIAISHFGKNFKIFHLIII